jgi:hypothetical protein
MPSNGRQTIEHEIGVTGSIQVRTADGDISVRAIDGAVVRVRALGERPIEEDYQIERLPGRLEISPRDRSRFDIGAVLGQETQALEIDLPRAASARIETASGSVDVVGVTGDQRYQSASGQIALGQVGGQLSVDTVSGDVRVDAVGEVGLEVRTVSGEIEASAPSFRSIGMKSMSGDVKVRGRLGGSGSFDIQTVSGDTMLALREPFRVELASVSGELLSGAGRPVAGGPGRRIVSAGSGGPLVAVRTISGDVRLLPASAESADAQPAASVADRERLAILRDLEQGRIDVDEAGRRLGALDSSSRETSGAGAAAAEDWRWDRPTSTTPKAPSRMRAEGDDDLGWVQRV